MLKAGFAAEPITLDTTPPAVVAAEFEFLSAQAVHFQISESLGGTLTHADLAVDNLTTGTAVPEQQITLMQTGTAYRVGFASVLVDGNYRASIAPDGVTDIAGNTLASGASSFDFFILAADANRNRSVNLDDFTILAANFGQTGKVFTQGNFNYSPDGRVNLDDFTILAAQFGKTLPPLADLPRAASNALSFPAARPAIARATFGGHRITDDPLLSHAQLPGDGLR